MQGFHTGVALNPQKAHELHLCVILHPHRALRWPNTIVMPTLSMEKEKCNTLYMELRDLQTSTNDEVIN